MNIRDKTNDYHRGEHQAQIRGNSSFLPGSSHPGCNTFLLPLVTEVGIMTLPACKGEQGDEI